MIEEKEKTEEEEKQAESGEAGLPIQKLAINFLTRFYIVFKILKLYAENNELIEEQTTLLMEDLNRLKAAEPEVKFRIKQESIFFNQQRLKFSLGNYHIFKFLLEEFRKREIGQLEFSPDIGRQELTRALAILCQKRTEAQPYEAIQAELQDNQITGLTLEKMQASERLLSPEKVQPGCIF